MLVLAHNLTPSETANLNPKFVKGFVTEIGGPGSHTAIVAEGLGIPAVVGIGPFLTDVSGGETAIIDGYQGLVILHPDEETLARYRHEVDAASFARGQAGKAARLAGGNGRRRADSAVGQHRVSLRSASSARSAGPTASGSTAPSFCILGRDDEPTGRGADAAYSRSGRGDERTSRS